MRFTGNATYAQLYPSRPSIDVCAKTYKAGSVFLDVDIEQGDEQDLFILARVNMHELIMICIADGNRWADRLIPITVGNTCTEFDFVAIVGGDFKFVGMSKDVFGVELVAAYFVRNGEIDEDA